jgi:hypothetical protein
MGIDNYLTPSIGSHLAHELSTAADLPTSLQHGFHQAVGPTKGVFNDHYDFGEIHDILMDMME